jgi:hypothetical protein
MIDLDPETASEDISAQRPQAAVATNCVTGDGGPVGVLGAGYVGFVTSDAHWTIDLGHGRLCRSDEVIEPSFVGSDEWTPIQALWVTQTTITALTNDGTCLSTPAAWTSAHRSAQPAPV